MSWLKQCYYISEYYPLLFPSLSTYSIGCRLPAHQNPRDPRLNATPQPQDTQVPSQAPSHSSPKPGHQQDDCQQPCHRVLANTDETSTHRPSGLKQTARMAAHHDQSNRTSRLYPRSRLAM